jgi:hypothetical protein
MNWAKQRLTSWHSACVEIFGLRPGAERLDRRIPPLGDGIQWRITCFVTVVARGSAWRAGTVSLFEREGFCMVGRPSEKYVVMQLAV